MMKWLAVAMLVLLSGCLIGGNGDWPLQAERDGAVPSRAGATRGFAVATYNVSQLIHPDAVRHDIAGAAADIWLLQEVIASAHSPGQTVRQLLPDGNWDVATVRVNPAADPSQVECQAIASRFPIRRVAIWPLEVQTERRRCALAAWIEVDGAELLVVNTDHEPGFFGWTITQDKLLGALAGYLQQQPAGPVVVGGDFNTCGNFWRLRSSAADAANTISYMRGCGFASSVPPGTISYNRAGLCLDHVFYRGVHCLKTDVITAARGSPHFPLRARMALDPS
jgi:endonuclease/exonuclease/phosphatase family metal-dependent hydrolase